ncbi:hypothetical protein H9Q10_01960 [Eikenella sp. S3360]|uniref:Uncharacterized protein n=1 Tax=Eikenella glucosivorans TaxID=2766967 RepID=A0ABS0N801_9NEIS|nr:hypothetical protein [Eikenella glucosivorans]MBH5328437.1 hypothetical protein [Eikenella glucosivorans]
MKLQRFFIVQSLESYDFLCSDDSGDVGFTPVLARAGCYESREDAVEAGIEEIGAGFAIFEFLRYLED